VFEEALKTWLEKQKISESSSSSSEHDQLSHVENNILLDFAEVAESLIRRSDLPSVIIETNTNPVTISNIIVIHARALIIS